MEEIASAFAANGLPDGFHHAAAEIFAGTPRTASSTAAVDADAERDAATLVADAHVDRDARGRA